ncbi:MAG: ABC transporter permease [Streptosporangiales bacterium]|nr:ABC transporter permease [Streptosporangiales bacterium]
MASEADQQKAPRPSFGRAVADAVLYGNSVVVTLLALLCALVVGAVLIVIGDAPTRQAMGYLFAAPGDALSSAAFAIGNAYGSLFKGAIFNPDSASGGFTGVMYPISETMVSATPLILAGLAVALAFRTGLFNIGAQGQIIMGAICAGYVGFAWDLPPVLHLLVALLAGMVGGGIWGGIAGFLKARAGAHEVISTIMLNYIAYNFLAFLLTARGFQRPPYSQAISNNVLDTARLPGLLGPDLRVHAGLVVALLAALAVWWLLNRSTPGFQLRAVGANQFAARTAGMRVERSYIYVMLLAGALSGLAGCSQILGTNPAITQDIDGGFGFDAITVALLGRGKAGGTVLAGLLFGALRAGGVQMQSTTGTSIDLVMVVQSVIVLFIAAPALIRAIFRLRDARGGVRQDLAKGWNG